jgi:hypothetical protein
MGGQISLTYTSLYPTDVVSLWLLDSGGVWSAPKSERVKIVEAGGRNPLMARTEEEFAQVLPFVMRKPPYVPRFMLNVMAQERIRNFDLEQRIYNEDVTYQMEPHIVGLDTPTLIVWGKEDRSHNVAAADILHKLLPRSEVIIIPGVGHLPMIEQPDKVCKGLFEVSAVPRQFQLNQSITFFCRRLSGGRSGRRHAWTEGASGSRCTWSRRDGRSGHGTSLPSRPPTSRRWPRRPRRRRSDLRASCQKAEQPLQVLLEPGGMSHPHHIHRVKAGTLAAGQPPPQLQARAISIKIGSMRRCACTLAEKPMAHSRPPRLSAAYERR